MQVKWKVVRSKPDCRGGLGKHGRDEDSPVVKRKGNLKAVKEHKELLVEFTGKVSP